MSATHPVRAIPYLFKSALLHRKVLTFRARQFVPRAELLLQLRNGNTRTVHEPHTVGVELSLVFGLVTSQG